MELRPTTGRTSQTSTGLELRSLTGADSGLYRCAVTNVAGSASSEATLLVHGESETRVLALSMSDLLAITMQCVVTIYIRACLGRPPLLPSKNGLSRQVVSRSRSYKKHFTGSQAVTGVSETGMALV